MNIEQRNSFRKIMFLIVFFEAALIAFIAGSLLQPVHAQEGGNGHIKVNTIISDGISIDETIINGPSSPPPGYERERAAVDLSEPIQALALHTLTVPAYNWVFGCSSVSGAMIAGYYDRNGYPEMYLGPTDGGVMPLNNSVWPTWSDGIETYPNLPLAATHNGVDGRVTRGSIDDYWVSYNSAALDPYITNGWTQHTWGEAIGDYMKTSQSAFSNSDGSTTFYTYTSQPGPLTCATMETSYSNGIQISTRDGTYGRKLFYEARGYTVTDCYNQKTDNNGGGFSLAMYKAEIDAGRPVMINLNGHTIVGIGYDDASSAIYIHDTWDYNDHTMIWGGSYSGMAMLSVSIVNLQQSTTPPAAFGKTSPANPPADQIPNLSLRWETSRGAASYEYCIDDSSNNACDSSWVSSGANTQVLLTSLATGNHSWQVRAVNGFGNTEANGGTWWSFTVVPPKSAYLPLVYRLASPPGAFHKTAPANGAINQSTSPKLSWETSSNATAYEYCYDMIDNAACDTSWASTATSTSIPLSGLSPTTSYFWQVRANNAGGFADADGGTWWSFTTAAPSTWVTIIHEDFEGDFPGVWELDDVNGTGIIWGKRDCKPFAGSYSGWGIGGGSSGSSLGCGSNYTDGMNTWMVYGPFNLADALAADLSFQLWLNSEPNWDWMCRYASINNVDYHGSCVSGNTAGWIDRVLDLGSVDTLGSLLGQPQVWIALTFSSDELWNYPDGAYVDDILLRKCTSGSCTSSPAASNPATGLMVEAASHITIPR